MIEPLRKGEPYPGRIPPVRAQWARVNPVARLIIVVFPVAIVGGLFAASVAAGVAAAVLAVGVALATATYVKNRTDRHNAAVDRGEIRVPPDPHLTRVEPSSMSPELLQRLAALGYPAGRLARVQRFDGGWLAERRQRTELGVVLGDDGGIAYYDPRWVPDVRAATEYLAGRGREPLAT
ncbi:MAG TPA: hypothetical protein VFV02_12880 [Acidimicrobiales bacterium]|nr:hypothetical protein [Acidimicrobiales bacterium]